jgi:hypothetical protein
MSPSPHLRTETVSETLGKVQKPNNSIVIQSVWSYCRWGMATVREPTGKGISAVGSRYRKARLTDREALVCPTAIREACGTMRT